MNIHYVRQPNYVQSILFHEKIMQSLCKNIKISNFARNNENTNRE